MSAPVPLLTSSALAQLPHLDHGFTTRHGGLSEGSFASLNLGTRTADQRSVVETNRRRVLTTLGRADAQLITLRQVHGAEVVQISHVAGRSIPADGLWTVDPAAVVGVLVADCVPVLIADTGGRAVAAVHAGWRGTRAHIVTRAIERLEAFGIPPADLRLAIGPAIGPCCFEIGDDVAAELEAAFPGAGDAIRRSPAGRPRADLWSLNAQAARAAGVTDDQIDVLRHCTSCDDRFFSHRRDGPGTGRQAGVIGLRRR